MKIKLKSQVIPVKDIPFGKFYYKGEEYLKCSIDGGISYHRTDDGEYRSFSGDDLVYTIRPNMKKCYDVKTGEFFVYANSLWLKTDRCCLQFKDGVNYINLNTIASSELVHVVDMELVECSSPN